MMLRRAFAVGEWLAPFNFVTIPFRVAATLGLGWITEARRWQF